ncbi:uncharacterized protein [Macrobrachium rosenbergii]|uniref:uncharacterized protein n=1 Tax=Macrobrachium rosenbergii TaxID=79674 RepID=UPI0034D42B47
MMMNEISYCCLGTFTQHVVSAITQRDGEFYKDETKAESSCRKLLKRARDKICITVHPLCFQLGESFVQQANKVKQRYLKEQLLMGFEPMLMPLVVPDHPLQCLLLF